MDLLRPVAPSYRAAIVAVAVSAAVHGVAIVGLRMPQGGADGEPVAYEASLAPAEAVGAAPAPVAAPAPRARPRRAKPIAPDETVAFLPETIAAAELAPLEAEPLEAAPAEVLALAQPPAVFIPPELPPFRPDALPSSLTIDYSLTSAFADGQATYTWERDGDRYEISGTASAAGFFSVILEGKVDQLTRGHVTPGGLRPDRFTERLGSGPEEGLEFDWDARQVEFRYSDKRRTGPLTESSVDWLSMIFQLAHRPPTGDRLEIRVYTQRRALQYRLQVLGFEELDLPFGRARTLHLRHTGEKPEETVDVWLGADQHYLPVKLRYPVARNRLVVEQTATSIRSR